MNASSGGCPFHDPGRLYADLADVRLAGGLPRSKVFGARIVTRYDDIVRALHDPETFSSRPTVPEMPSPWRERFEGRVPSRGTLLGIDQPDHDRLRSSVNTFFVPRRLERFEPWLRETAHRLIDEFVEDGACDLKTAFALPMPLKAISRIVGLNPDRSEFYGAALGFFMGPRDIHHAGTPEQKADLLLALHDELLELMEERRTDRRDDLISHIWNERDAGSVQMSDFEMLSMFPGLMLAGHETSSNLICIALSHLLPDAEAWERVQHDDASRAAALEEIFRLESAITGMKRLVTRDTELGGVALSPGDEVFLAYAAGSHDPNYFAHPDDLDLDRTFGTPHLGFGQGIHACLGAPLARILLRVELGVLRERLPGLRVKDQPHHTPVAEGRGIESLTLSWNAQPRRAVGLSGTPFLGDQPQTIGTTVTAVRQVAHHIVELQLSPDAPLGGYAAGAHIDLYLTGGFARQYSLLPADDSDSVRIAVLLEDAGRGGSAAAHRLRTGDRVRVGRPRNHFALRSDGPVLLVAGGIGITPIAAMAAEADARGLDWRMLYLAASPDRAAYLHELQQRHPGRVDTWFSSESGRYPLDRIWLRGDELVHACGPAPLIAAIESTARVAHAEGRLFVERFAPLDIAHGPDRPFDAELARSGRIVRVAAGERLLDAVNRVGAGVLSTCREGTCGTCEVRVLAGVPEHRDSVLTIDERLQGDTIMTCVSRCIGDHLVLDL